jgi:hypothetical protein
MNEEMNERTHERTNERTNEPGKGQSKPNTKANITKHAKHTKYKACYQATLYPEKYSLYSGQRFTSTSKSNSYFG